MKKFCFALLAAGVALPAFAGGPLDGIYQCNIGAAGQSYSLFLTLNGHGDGQTLYVQAAIGNNSPFKGYGIGQATATTFAGSTHDGLSFAMTASNNGKNIVLNGTSQARINNQVVDAGVSCTQIF